MSILKLRKQFQKTQAIKQDKQNYDQALVGHPDGTVYVGTDRPGYIWARLNGVSGRLIQVNARGWLATYNLPVMVTHPPYRQDDWQIVDLNYGGFSGSGTDETPVPWDGNPHIGPHAAQHYATGGDAVLLDWSQLSTLVVEPSSGLIVRVRQGVLPRIGIDVLVAVQTLDLTSNVPATGARYVLLSLDVSGVLVATNGTTAASVSALGIANVPDTPAGNFRLCAVRLYAGQTTIRGRTSTSNDILDLRWPQEVSNVTGITTPPSTLIFNGNPASDFFEGIEVANGWHMEALNSDTTIQSVAVDHTASSTEIDIFFITPEPLYLSAVTGGVVTVHFDAKASTGSVITVFFKLYTILADGTKTLLCTSGNTSALTTGFVSYTLTAILSDSLIDPGARLLVEFWSNNTSGSSELTQIQWNGSTNARLIMPGGAGGVSALALPNGKIFVGSSAGIATAVTPSGVITIDTSGVTSFGSFASSVLKTALTDETGSGVVVFNDTPTLITPILGVATATSINKVAITAPATSATLTLADGTTLSTLGTIGFPAAGAIGDLMYGSSATAFSRLADVATGNVLISGGVATAPSWGKVDVTAHITGVLPVANGGTNIASYAVGDLIYASGATTLSKLADVAAGQPLLSGGVTTAPAYAGFYFTGTAGGTTSFAVTNTKTLTLTATDNYNLTIPATGTAALATGISGGQTIYGGTAANDDLILHGTSNATRTTSYVILQPTAGNVGIRTSTPSEALEVNGNIALTSGGGQTVTTAGNQLVLSETGDTLGTVSLTLKNRSGANGAVFTNSSLDLVDFGFVTSTTAQWNLRLEHRGASLIHASNTSGEFQYYSASDAAFPFYFGSVIAGYSGSFGVGTILPASKFHVYTTASGGGIIFDGTNNPQFRGMVSGSEKLSIGVVTSAGSFLADSAASDICFRATATKKLLFGATDGTNGSTLSIGASATVINDNGYDHDFRIEGDTDANLIVADAGLDKVSIGILTPASKLHVATGVATAGIVNILTIDRTNASPANNDGQAILFQATDSTTAAQAMARLYSKWIDKTHASATSNLVASAYYAGTERVALTIAADSVASQTTLANSIAETVTSTAVDLTLTSAHRIVLVTDSKTITLPTAASITGRAYNIINASASSTVTVATTSSQTISGDLTLTLSGWESVVVYSDGTNWIRGS